MSLSALPLSRRLHRGWLVFVIALSTLASILLPGFDGSSAHLVNEEISFELAASGVSGPMHMAEPPDGTGRVFIVSNPGLVYIAVDGELLREPFLDISDQVTSEHSESGLFSIAFHPDYSANGLFFLSFTRTDAMNVVMRYQVSDEDADRADPASGRTVLAIPDKVPEHHNGGGLAFGPDGYLYISTGDDATEEDAQSLLSLHGKILRIDPVTKALAVGDEAYRIPPDNPYAEVDDARPEIWASGLRNPWRFSFDRETGDLYIADVGQSNWEEINHQPAASPGGENYGWPIMEGNHCFRPADGCDQAGLTLPVAEYSHDEGCAIIGGHVYRGTRSPALDGHYLFTDICSGMLRGLTRDADGSWTVEPLGDTHLTVTSFAEDQAGEVYILSFESGALRRVVAAEPARFDSPAYEATWARTDRPVAGGDVARTWTWGPWETGRTMIERYEQSPDGWRTVIYLDKSRMEITSPDDDSSQPWYVTNGLLVVELITGRIQVGDNYYAPSTPAEVNVAGDADDQGGPTYASFLPVLDRAPLPVDSIVTQRLSRAGGVTVDDDLAEFAAMIVTIDEVTNHAVAEPFWELMHSQGLIWEDGELQTGALFPDPIFATGRPITDPYWADVAVGGTVKPVLIQCFERRCLTFTPDNPEGWRVEAGNVGQHYWRWRYGS